MKKIKKSEIVPLKLNRYFTDNPNKTWEEFSKGNKNRYKDIIKQIKKDQGGICCYCENNFHNQIDREGDFRIEHFHPKSDISNPSINWNLIWTNLLGCCSGGNQNISNPDFLLERYIPNHEDRHCDVLKDDNIWDDEILNPLYDIPAFPPIFRISSDGEMSVLEQNCHDADIDIIKAKNCLDKNRLNLNSPFLKDWRRDVINNLRDEISEIFTLTEDFENAVKTVLSAHLEKDANENYSAFFTTIRSYFAEDAEEFLKLNGYDG
jgi:uncharacterized protein (TIGR02646 family)